MAGNAAPFNQNFTEKKSNDIVEKDVRKWVESVVEFKASLDKQKGNLPIEKHLKKIKKFKMKRKPSVLMLPVTASKDPTAHQKSDKPKKGTKKAFQQTPAEKPPKKEQLEVVDVFDTIKESYRNLKLPQNWTSGVSGNRVVFNRVKLTTQNSQQKVAVEKSLVITKDCNVHVLIKGSEVAVSNWEIQKIDTLDDIKKAIKDIDCLKLCEGPQNGAKSPQCSMVVDKKQKVCEACKSETANSPKKINKKPRTTKKTGGTKTGAPKKVISKLGKNSF